MIRKTGFIGQWRQSVRLAGVIRVALSGIVVPMAVLGGGGLAGCASTHAIDRTQLPDTPVVFLYRTEDEATRRADIVKRARTGLDRPREGEMRARLGQVADYLGVGTTELEKRAEAQGQLSELDSQTHTVVPQRYAVRGARPLDWNAERTRLLYVSPRRGAPQIMEYDRVLGSLREVTRGPRVHATGCFGPDGRIAYSEVETEASGFTSRILVLEDRTGEARPVSPGPRDSSPAWSPDGRVLLYVIDAASNAARIVAIDPSRDDPPRIVARGRSPAFSPDGSWVVYSAHTAKGWRLWRMRPDGSGKRSLGGGNLDEHWPSISPDGGFVAYSVEGNYRQQLRVRRFDGTGDRPLLERGDGAHPVWN